MPRIPGGKLAIIQGATDFRPHSRPFRFGFATFSEGRQKEPMGGRKLSPVAPNNIHVPTPPPMCVVPLLEQRPALPLFTLLVSPPGGARQRTRGHATLPRVGDPTMLPGSQSG